MESISPNDIGAVLEGMYSLRKELVPCFIGKPGIGKTQGVYSFAKSKGVNVVTFILSNTVPSEVSGIRMPDKDTKKMEVFDDQRMASLKDGDILFFDEILEAPAILQGAVLTLIQDRIMASGRKLPDVMIIAASNPVYNPKTLSEAFRDRFIFLDVEFNKEQWMEYVSRRWSSLHEDDLVGLTLSLEDYVSVDGYNVFTPRKAVKLLEYVLDESGDWEMKKRVLELQFGARNSVSIRRFIAIHDRYFKQHSPEQKLMVDMLGNLKIDLPDELPDMTVDEIFDWIEKQSPQIKTMIELEMKEVPISEEA